MDYASATITPLPTTATAAGKRRFLVGKAPVCLSYIVRCEVVHRTIRGCQNTRSWQKDIREKGSRPTISNVLTPHWVGITGLEPATPSSRTTCATNCAKSRLLLKSECKGKCIFYNTEIFCNKNLRKQKKAVPLQPQSGNRLPRNTAEDGAIAQLVEQRTENPCVPGSIPGGTTIQC